MWSSEARNSGVKPTHSLIWMYDMLDIGPKMLEYFNTKNSLVPPDTRVVLLSAPEPNDNKESNDICWFNILKANMTGILVDENEVKNSYEVIKKYIDDEAKLYKGDYKKVAIGGFYQGAALSLYTALKFNKELAGACGLSHVHP